MVRPASRRAERPWARSQRPPSIPPARRNTDPGILQARRQRRTGNVAREDATGIGQRAYRPDGVVAREDATGFGQRAYRPSVCRSSSVRTTVRGEPIAGPADGFLDRSSPSSRRRDAQPHRDRARGAIGQRPVALRPADAVARRSAVADGSAAEYRGRPCLRRVLTRQFVQVAFAEPVVSPFLVEHGAEALPHCPPLGVRGPSVVVGHRRGLRELIRRDLGQPRLDLRTCRLRTASTSSRLGWADGSSPFSSWSMTNGGPSPRAVNGSVSPSTQRRNQESCTKTR